mmetsp:Transcript_10079/g.24736  ORF Transcript_10079/g.24736 Transcript_10079/m.24736 type:complete len:235 (+) Transcript_10079:493-1197(+)
MGCWAGIKGTPNGVHQERKCFRHRFLGCCGHGNVGNTHQARQVSRAIPHHVLPGHLVSHSSGTLPSHEVFEERARLRFTQLKKQSIGLGRELRMASGFERSLGLRESGTRAGSVEHPVSVDSDMEASASPSVVDLVSGGGVSISSADESISISSTEHSDLMGEPPNKRPRNSEVVGGDQCIDLISTTVDDGASVSASHRNQEVKAFVIPRRSERLVERRRQGKATMFVDKMCHM